MRSLELIPSPALRPYVQLIWCFELDADEPFDTPERVAPDGILELVLHYVRPLATRFDGESFALQPTSALVSQTKRFVEFSATDGTGFISVRFFPWGACHFLKPPVHVLADRQTMAEDVWGSRVRDLEERLVSAVDMTARVRLVEQFLLELLSRNEKPNPEALIRHLRNAASSARVSDLSRELGLTERQLERKCLSTLGMSPRSYLRLMRFLRACQHLRRGRRETLTSAAIQCGYYDQAHFAHDFRQFLNMTPSQFLRSTAVSFLQLD